MDWPVERSRTLMQEVRAAYLDDSAESTTLFEQLTLDALEILTDEEWDALYTELMGRQANER